MSTDRKFVWTSLICEVFIFIVLALANNETRAACPVHEASSVAAQQCLTGIAFMNGTMYSMDEICRMYVETLYCAKRFLHKEGLDCNLQDIGTVLSSFFTTLGPRNTDYSQCKLEPEVTDLCLSEERLSQYSLIACGPYLDQMQFVGDPNGACAYSSYLVECAERSVSYLGVTCTKAEIESAFKSQPATQFLARHVQGLDLSQCFHTVGVNEDKNCVNYMTIFSYGNTTTCMSTLPNVNLTKGMDSQDKMMQCSYVQEVEACMVKHLQGSGSNCTLAQMNSALNIYIHLSDGMRSNLVLITECPANDNYVSTSMCSDDFRLMSFLYTSGGSVFESLSGYNNKDLVCSTILSYAGVLMKSQDINCTSSQIFSALTSSFGTSFINNRYPQLDFNHCVTSSQSDEMRSFGSRKRRNAVAVKEWLWKDNKIPYVIDKSEFSTTGVLMIIKAIKQFNEDISCVKFTPRVNEFDYIRFKSGQGCHSSIGRDGGEQTLTIGPDCYYLGVILHEMTHAVGFFHEQNRWDRDDYVTILWKNIQEGKEHDFNIQDQRYLDTLGAPYDYGSIMHYGPYIFSKDPNRPAMTPTYDPRVEMGQRNGFSKLDIWKINTLYGCKSGAPPLPEWMSYLSSTLGPTTQPTTPTTPTLTLPTSPLVPGIPAKPKVLVTVFPNALRINWNQPPSTDEITGYLITIKLEPNGRRQQVRVAANKLAYYLSTYTSHPGRRYTITIAAITDKGVGPESDPVTTRSACSQTVYLDNDSYDKIHSPFFKHGYYEQDVVCQWLIRTPTRQHINLTFTSLNISGDGDCSGDYVRIGNSRMYCNNPPANGNIIMATNDVEVTFVSKPGPTETKQGGFAMIASAQGYSPINLNIDELVTGLNVSWEPPLQTPSAVSAYVINYKLTSDAVAKEVVVSSATRYFLLSTYPHFGREYSVEVYAKYPTGNSEPAGPTLIRSKCSRNITVTDTSSHLNSPHYPNKYEPGTVCDWNITPTSGHRLVLDFERADINRGDHVDILSEGTYMRVDVNNKPTNQIITKAAKVQFVSDGSGEGQGFRINLSLAPL